MVQIMENKLVSHPHHGDMELLKTAMLRHEETFRQQVVELHRLYRVQKQLMAGGGLQSRPSSESELRQLSCRRQIRRRRRRRQQPRRALDLLHLSAGITPPPSTEDGLELTLAIGGGGRCRRRRRRDETAGGSEPDISGGGLTTATTDTGGSPPYQRAMPTAFCLQEQEAAAAATVVAKQPSRSPWLVQCVSLEMA